MPIFKNLKIFRFTEPFNLGTVDIRETLRQYPARPVGEAELSSFGWVPTAADTFATLIDGRYLYLTAQREERVLPSSVVAKKVAEQVKVLEKAENRLVLKKEISIIKDQVIFELLPKAFTKTTLMHAYIDLDNQWLIVDSSSSSKAEDLLSLLRKSWGSLPVTPWCAAGNTVSYIVSEWLDSKDSSDKPVYLTIDEDAELRIFDAKNTKIIYKNKNLFGGDVHEALQTGFGISKLALTWRDRISFILTSDLEIKRLKFLDFDAHPGFEEVESREEYETKGLFIQSAEFALLLDDLTSIFFAPEEDSGI